MPKGGSKFDQFIVGDNAGGTIYGSGGADHILGKGGNDYIYANDDNDLVNGGRGNDWIFGGNGHDVLNGNAGNDKVVGENGDDVLNGGRGADELWGDFSYSNSGSGNDILTGGAGDDTLGGGGGDDTFVHSGINAGGDGFDTIYGGDFDVATPSGGGSWEVNDVIQIDATNFGFYDTAPITAGELSAYLLFPSSDVLHADLDGAGSGGSEAIIDTNVSSGGGVAVEINEQLFVYNDGWIEVV